jgi:cysteine synthase A
MLPDTGERYLTTPLFEDVPSDMTAEEQEISRSTPGYRFDTPSASPPPAAEREAAPAVDDASNAFVADVIGDGDQPVALFALEWCEFCWSVRKLFAQCEIPYRSIDLDSVEYQEGDRGGRIRAALNARTGMATIPQIFVGGELIGGCTELFDAFNEGRLQQLLGSHGVDYDASVSLDAYELLPKWLQAR